MPRPVFPPGPLDRTHECRSRRAGGSVRGAHVGVPCLSVAGDRRRLVRHGLRARLVGLRAGQRSAALASGRAGRRWGARQDRRRPVLQASRREVRAVRWVRGRDVRATSRGGGPSSAVAGKCPVKCHPQRPGPKSSRSLSGRGEGSGGREPRSDTRRGRFGPRNRTLRDGVCGLCDAGGRMDGVVRCGTDASWRLAPKSRHASRDQPTEIGGWSCHDGYRRRSGGPRNRASRATAVDAAGN